MPVPRFDIAPIAKNHLLLLGVSSMRVLDEELRARPPQAPPVDVLEKARLMARKPWMVDSVAGLEV